MLEWIRQVGRSKDAGQIGEVKREILRFLEGMDRNKVRTSAHISAQRIDLSPQNVPRVLSTMESLERELQALKGTIPGIAPCEQKIQAVQEAVRPSNSCERPFTDSRLHSTRSLLGQPCREVSELF